MCGICGVIGRNEVELVRRMTSVMRHRGPDDEGIVFYDDGNYPVSFGHRRLSIIDLSYQGHQPMRSRDGRYTIVYNGEIYNFRELRDELKSFGYTFRSLTDTEVLLAAYDQWGEECLSHLNGMFSFCIWDKSRRRAFLARDRLGVKPLYYSADSQSLIFSSELKSLVMAPWIKKTLDSEALVSSLTLRWVPEPKTMFQNVWKLLAGHYMIYEKNRISLHKYWDISIQTVVSKSEEEWVEQFKELFDQSVKRRMISDVPLGICLSGGLDSSAILSSMAMYSTERIRAYTITFRQKDLKQEAMPEDRKFARLVADKYNADLKEIEIDPSMLELLPKIIWHLDEPIADPAAINTYLISEMAYRDGTKVLLSGMGADEMWGGYRKHQAIPLMALYRKVIPPFVRNNMILPWISQMPVAGNKGGYRHLRWLKKFITSIGNSQLDDMMGIYSYFHSADMANLFKSTIYNHHWGNYARDKHREYYEKGKGQDLLTRMCLMDTKLFLPSLNLAYSDKVSMAASVEMRSPFVDYTLAELAFQMPSKYKMRFGQSKYVVRQAMKHRLPKQILSRSKGNFGAPIRAWGRTGIEDFVADCLSKKSVNNRGLWNFKAVEKILIDHKKGLQDNAHKIWILLTCELWFRSFMDQQPTTMYMGMKRETTCAKL